VRTARVTSPARAAHLARKEKYLPERLDRAFWKVRGALHEPWTVAKLAREAGCSIVHCNHTVQHISERVLTTPIISTRSSSACWAPARPTIAANTASSNDQLAQV